MRNPLKHRIVRSAGIAVLAGSLLTSITISPASAAVNHRVIVGMGDSFTSGDGAPPFARGTDTATNTCHRSLVAYPIVAGVAKLSPARNVACSGAVTDDLFRTFKTEAPQVSRLQGATDLVVTIGGNDIDALGALSQLPTPEELQAKLTALFPKLVQTYAGIRAAAPQARLHVSGYPIIISGETGTANCPLDQPTRQLLIAAQQALNSTIQAAAGYAGVNYLDVSNALAGHEVCTPIPFVNGVVPSDPEYSFHPNQAGQIAIGLKVAQLIQ